MTKFPCTALMFCLLSACSTPAIRLDPVIQAAPPLVLPPVEPLVLKPVIWNVVGTTYTLDATNLRNLIDNLIQIRKYLSEQTAVIALLKSAYATQGSTDTSAK